VIRDSIRDISIQLHGNRLFVIMDTQRVRRSGDSLIVDVLAALDAYSVDFARLRKVKLVNLLQEAVEAIVISADWWIYFVIISIEDVKNASLIIGRKVDKGITCCVDGVAFIEIGKRGRY
jgi:hypothetical protein